MSRKVLPRHIGFIPDGNRRWAMERELPKEAGYASGFAPGLALYEHCKALGIDEVSVYGFTQDNTRRPSAQTAHFRAACVGFAMEISRRGARLLVVGDERSAQFPPELERFRTRQGEGFEPAHLSSALGWFRQQDRALGG
ncbi:MAG: undecaprenyl diphosphate synthase family protein [Pseudomonadota bacterium]|nr:undecaprenyl diphosphate synthase family protein [Pseudomonadota bacterium]